MNSLFSRIIWFSILPSVLCLFTVSADAQAAIENQERNPEAFVDGIKPNKDNNIVVGKNKGAVSLNPDRVDDNPCAGNDYSFWRLIISAGMALFGLPSLFFAAFAYNRSVAASRMEALIKFHDMFLDNETLRTREKMADYWSKKMTRDPRKKVNKICSLKYVTNDKMEEKIRNELGITYAKNSTASLDDDTKRATNDILNKFEWLGKLKVAKTIDDDQIKTMFYTMIADTFLLCVPYILHRRINDQKEQYAEKFQSLLEIVPYISNDLANV